MKKFKTSTRVLAVMAAIAMLHGCAGDAGKKNSTSKKSEEIKQETSETKAENTNDTASVYHGTFPKKLGVEKIGEAAFTTNMLVGAGGIYYKDADGKYGVASFDGKHDTGAKYDYCAASGKFFSVVSDTPDEGQGIEAMNIFGVIDAEGSVIVPEAYASIRALNDRYVYVCEVTEQTDSKDEALIYATDRVFSVSANDDDSFFKGNWCVYDAMTGEKVPGISGTQSPSIMAYGDLLSFYADDGNKKTVDSKGKEIPADARVYANGAYSLEKDGAGTVYNSGGKVIFTYSVDDCQPYTFDERSGCYIARKSVDGKSQYMLMDEAGNVVSAAVDDIPSVYGEYILSGSKVYDFSGNRVLDGEFTTCYRDDMTKVAAVFGNDEETVILKDGGDVIYREAKSDDVFVGSDFTAEKKFDGVRKCYSFKDNDYTIDGNSSGCPWLVKTSFENGETKLIDTISGEVLLSGYNNYISADADGTFYIYAVTADGTDIYLVKQVD